MEDDAPLIDVSGMSLADLRGISESSLGRALRQVLDDDRAGTSAGFTSSV
jgi:FXSXX-COOH protein